MAFISLLLAGASLVVVLTPGYEMLGIMVALMSAIMAQSASISAIVNRLDQIQDELLALQGKKAEDDTDTTFEV